MNASLDRSRGLDRPKAARGAGSHGVNTKRALAAAVGVWVSLALFGLLYRTFERDILAPSLGAEAAAFLAKTTLAGAILFAAPLLIGTTSHSFTFRQLWAIGAIWAFLTV